MIPTTLEMDKIFTEKDLADRHFIMKPCIACAKFNKIDLRVGDTPCVYCGGTMGKASTYWSSMRTFNPQKKISVADRKKMGA